MSKEEHSEQEEHATGGKVTQAKLYNTSAVIKYKQWKIKHKIVFLTWSKSYVSGVCYFKTLIFYQNTKSYCGNEMILKSFY